MARKDIVMIHGANCGAWCFEKFRPIFADAGWTCHIPDLPGHEPNAAEPDAVKGLGMADYRKALDRLLSRFAEPPVLLGHSMGAVLAQQLAAEGRASALVLLSPAPRNGILPPTDSEKKLCTDLMSIGPFWTRALPPDFELACYYSINRIPEGERRAIFERFVPESGRALFELFFWMFDQERATAVDVSAVRCPVYCLSGTDDNLVSIETARAVAESYPGATFVAAEGHGHLLLLDPGAEKLASGVVGWLRGRGA
jgi:non-heme chloroperoxidase